MTTVPADGLTRLEHSSFVVPGDYVDDADGARMVGQLAVERLTLGGDLERPRLVLVHGGGLTGACFGTTPDGRPGWAEHLAASGYDVHVVDQPARGRSGAHTGRQALGPAPTVDWVEEKFTACARRGPGPPRLSTPGGRAADAVVTRSSTASSPRSSPT